MSKMSQLHAELSERAAELGFESIEEAERAGYKVDYDNMTLMSPEEQAHEAWLIERTMVLKELDLLETYFEEVIDRASEDDDAGLDTMFILNNLKGYVEDAVDFIKRGEQ